MGWPDVSVMGGPFERHRQYEAEKRDIEALLPWNVELE